MTPWDCGGSSFDRSLDPDRQQPKKPLPEKTPADKIKAFLHQMRERLCPPTPTAAPAYTSTFRLSKEEYALFNLMADLRMPVALHTDLVLEWSESLRLGYSEYPFRLPDENLVCSICISPLFKSVRDWEGMNP